MFTGHFEIMREKVFVRNKCVGDLVDGVWEQRITDRHIYRVLNAKGMDVNLHLALQGKCHTWRLRHKQTGQVLSIPFVNIEILGTKVDTGAGVQYMVALSDFTEQEPVKQARMI